MTVIGPLDIFHRVDPSIGCPDPLVNGSLLETSQASKENKRLASFERSTPASAATYHEIRPQNKDSPSGPKVERF